jgi:hypothetical protein
MTSDLSALDKSAVKVFEHFCSQDANERSLLEMLSPGLQKVASEIDPALLKLDEGRLETKLRPHAMLNRIRLAVWREYERCTGGMRKFKMANVSRALGVPTVTIMGWMRDPERLLWVLTPPSSYQAILEEAVVHGLNRLRNEILTMDVRERDMHGAVIGEGVVDPKKAELLLKAISYVDLRVNGSIVQKSEAKNLNLVAGTVDLRAVGKDIDAKELDDKIRELERRQAAAELRADAVATDQNGHATADHAKYADIDPEDDPYEMPRARAIDMQPPTLPPLTVDEVEEKKRRAREQMEKLGLADIAAPAYEGEPGYEGDGGEGDV